MTGSFLHNFRHRPWRAEHAATFHELNPQDERAPCISICIVRPLNAIGPRDKLARNYLA